MAPPAGVEHRGQAVEITILATTPEDVIPHKDTPHHFAMQAHNRGSGEFPGKSPRNSNHQNYAKRLPYTCVIAREPHCTGSQPGEPVKDTELYSIEQARKLLGGLSRNSLYQTLRSGELPSVLIGCRRFIAAGAITDFIAAATTRASPSSVSARSKRSIHCRPAMPSSPRRRPKEPEERPDQRSLDL